ncbi:hypothetical protein D3C71_2106240 [compost metagenome]
MPVLTRLKTELLVDGAVRKLTDFSTTPVVAAIAVDAIDIASAAAATTVINFFFIFIASPPKAIVTLAGRLCIE